MFWKLYKSMKDNKKGFTLVELMVVVIIIGVLVAIAIPVYNNVSGTAKTNACQANLRTIDGAYQVYLANDGTAVGAVGDINVAANDLEVALVADYLTQIPSCPADGTYSWHADGYAECDKTDHEYR